MPRRVEDIRAPDRRSIRNIPIEKPDAPRERSRNVREKRDEEPKTLNKLAKARPAAKERPEDRENAVREEIRAEIEAAKGGTLRTKTRSAPTVVPSTRVPINLPAERPKKSAPKKKRGWVWATAGIVIFIAGAGFVASLYFAEASFTIVPRSTSLTVDGTYVADNFSVATTSSLAYGIMTLTESASTTVPASDGAYISSKAQGKITLYNAYSGATVRLIAGTRFSDALGHVYRLSSSVVIPGATGTGTTMIAGTIPAAVTADQPGQDYNSAKGISAPRLSIVAYKGSAKYDSIYAKLSSDISGGFAGTKKTVSPSVIASSTAALKSALISSLATQAKASVPAGSIAYDAAYLPSFGTPATSGETANSATLSIAATLRVVVFQKANLIEHIAGPNAASQFGSFSYSTPGLDALAMTIANAKDFSPDKKNSLIFHLKGPLKLVGDIPVDELKHKLAGVSLADTQDILSKYSAIIESGSGELIPPWAKVPTDLSHISIKVQE